MQADIIYGILFVGIALLAQYLPAKWGVPIGLVAVISSLLALLKSGEGVNNWLLWLSVALLGLVIWRIIIHRGIFEKDKEKEKRKEERIEQAKNIQKEIMQLFTQLETEEETLPDTIEWNKNTQVRTILDKLQAELNNLGYLVKNQQYDRWVEHVMQMYSQMMIFHIKEHDSHYAEFGRARINANFREYINKIKG